MQDEVLRYSLLMLLGVFISSVAQVVLKSASQKQYESIVYEYLNVRVLSAYAVFFGATFLSILAYRVVPLSLGAILETTGYIYVTLFSVFIFHEKINKQKMMGLCIIVVGIILYALSSN